MACAVEQASVVLLCFTERYKNSPNCRLGQSTLSSTLASCTVRFLNTISQTICNLLRRNVCHFCFDEYFDKWRVQRCSGAGTRGEGVPHFFRQGDASPIPSPFWTEIRAKVSPFLQLVTYWNAVYDNFSTAELISICYRHSNTSSCIAGQDQRSAVTILLTCMSVRVCRPKLFWNLCLSLVSGVLHFFLGLGPHPWWRPHFNFFRCCFLEQKLGAIIWTCTFLG